VAYVRQRVLQLVVVLLIVTFITFLMINLLPGGPETAAVGITDDEQALEDFRIEHGLDDPIPVQYARWLGDAVTGDLGDSYVNNVPVREQITNRLPPTLQLIVYAEILSLLIAVPLGIAMAYRADTLFDKASGTVAFGLLSVPNFILAVLLVYFVSLKLDWLPATGYTPFSEDPTKHVKGMILPALSLAAGQIAVYSRLLRTDMIATLQEDYIGVARAKGMPTARILFRHALKPSSFTLLTVAAINVGQLIGGTIIIEQIFAINGIGELLITAIFRRDYLIVQGSVVLIAVSFVMINFLVDLLYAALDPRIRHARALA